jgi:NSS family neurotransmitter:Na+ symporter
MSKHVAGAGLMSSGGQMPKFSSRVAFMAATAGSAIGLGNIWSFTYVAGKNGGAGFMLVYLLALTFIATPIFMAELLLGRMGGATPVSSLKKLQNTVDSRLPWHGVAWVGMVATILVLSFYAVIAGQIMAYGYQALVGGMVNWDAATIRGYDAVFKAEPLVPLVWTALFAGATAVIVAFDVRTGIERASKLMMPALFIMLVALVIYSGFSGGFATAFDFLFGFNEMTFGPRLVMDAVGQSFFTLGVGVGGIMVMGAYLGEGVNLQRSAAWVVVMDLMIALLAGMAIFPLLFAANMEPDVGPGLVFVTLPLIFAEIPAGALVAFIFFLLLTFAALTSSIVLLSPTVTKLEEMGVKRPVAAWLMTGVVLALSLLTILSFSSWGTVYPLAFIGLDGMTWFDVIREGVSNVVLPLGGLSFALMVGWGLPRDKIQAALPMQDGVLFSIWYGAIRYVVPIAISSLFVTALFG